MTKIKKFKRGWIGGKTRLIVSSPFGVWRKLPHYKEKRRHNGIDINISQGTPLYAPVGGTLKCSFEEKGAGLYLTIVSDDIKFFFMHMSKTVVSVNGSKVVKEGDLIGYSGGAKGDKNAGGSTGPHLHFEARQKPYGKSKAFNPIIFFSDTLIDRNGNAYSKEVQSIPLISSQEEYEEQYVEINRTEVDEETPDISDENAIEIEETMEKELKTGLASGIWQITKLLMDGSVADLRLHDAATSIQAGSLMSFFNKICQQPFVEFMGDTFGDQYYFIVRKPPFDKEGMLKTLISQGLRKSENTYVEFGQSIYDISTEDIINTNLSFDSQNVYSWYQFYPVYEMGAANELKYIIPAVLFPEYAAIYGSRDLSIQSQYRSFNKAFIKDELNEKNKSQQGDAEVRHSIHDLKYIIECNAYNPFTRSGTIQIAGNRRIKRGVFIRIQAFNSDSPEIFYVDAVSHDYSVTSAGVNRTTTLSVSHGMIEKYMFEGEYLPKYTDSGKYIPEGISYFNVINFGDYENSKDKITMDSWMDIISSWKVNIDIFRFFLRKMQFMNISGQAVIKG